MGLIYKCLPIFRDGFARTTPTFSEDHLWFGLIGGNQDWFVLCVDGEPVTVAVYIVNRRGERSVWSLATKPRERRKGYARLLLEHIRDKAAKAAHTQPPTIYIRADSAELAAFYVSLGYTFDQTYTA